MVHGRVDIRSRQKGDCTYSATRTVTANVRSVSQRLSSTKKPLEIRRMSSSAQPQTDRTHLTSSPVYVLSKRMMRRRAKSNEALLNTHLAMTRSCTLSKWSMQVRVNRRVLTSRCRLRPLTFFPRVEAAQVVSIGHLHKLAVESLNASFAPSSCQAPDLFAQSRVYRFPSPVFAPSIEKLEYGPRRRKVVWQHTPGVSGANGIEDRIEDVAHLMCIRTATRLNGRNERFYAFMLCVGRLVE